MARSAFRLDAFLSYPFGLADSERYAQLIAQFLTELNVGVTTARAYQPRTVQAKVAEILQEPFDMVVVLVMADADSIWMRD